MVQQVKEKFKEYKWMHNGSTTPSKMTNASNTMSNSVESSPVTKEKGQDAKRKEPDSPFSPLNINKGPNTHIVYVRRKNISHVSDSSSLIKPVEANKETEPHKIHAEKVPERNSDIFHNHSIRRIEPRNSEIPSRIETEVLKVHLEKSEGCDKNNEVSNDDSINCPEPRNPEIHNKREKEMLKVHLERREDCNEEFSCLHERNNEMSHDNIVDNNAISSNVNVEQYTSAYCSKPSHVNVDLKKTSNDSDLNCPLRPNSSISHAEIERPNVLQNWKERYRNLQIFLNKCDQSSQEDYMNMLRSLTAADRSRHALELEKRALHLLLEEGKELSRMQVLNVLGQPNTQDNSSPSSQLEANCNQTSPYLQNKQ